jgi:hypothetical protein
MDGSGETRAMDLAMAFVRQEQFLWSKPDRDARLANQGSEQESLWSEVVVEIVAGTPASDQLIVLIVRHHALDHLALFGQGYLQPWIEKAEPQRLEWLAAWARTDDRARRTLSGVRIPEGANSDSSLWDLIPETPDWQP